MGIVVTIAMLLGLLLSVPHGFGYQWYLTGNQCLQRAIAMLVLIAGLWNTLWYGLQHPTQFWGIAAAGSGLVMITIAITTVYAARQRRLIQLLSLALLGFFLLYAITLIRLNLNMPIIG